MIPISDGAPACPDSLGRTRTALGVPEQRSYQGQQDTECPDRDHT